MTPAMIKELKDRIAEWHKHFTPPDGRPAPYVDPVELDKQMLRNMLRARSLDLSDRLHHAKYNPDFFRISSIETQAEIALILAEIELR